jgi:hypothetical protein
LLATFLIFHKWLKNSNNKTATFIFEKGAKNELLINSTRDEKELSRIKKELKQVQAR